MSGQGDSNRAILFALGANFVIFATKGIAAFITGSSAMLAETVHSLADCGNQLLLLLGLRQARMVRRRSIRSGMERRSTSGRSWSR